METTIARAVLTDLPVLAEINRLAYLRETVAQFAFINWPDEAHMLNFFMTRVEEDCTILIPRFSRPSKPPQGKS